MSPRELNVRLVIIRLLMNGQLLIRRILESSYRPFIERFGG
jgi:hypothetical protein